MYNQVHLIYSNDRDEWRSTQRGFNGSLARPNCRIELQTEAEGFRRDAQCDKQCNLEWAH